MAGVSGPNDPAATASKLVSHYLDHIQPAIDELARREKQHFVELDPNALPEECAAGEHSLARMQCFHRFQQLVAEGVDHWCRHSNVTEELLAASLQEASQQAKLGKETNGTILLELLCSVHDFGTFAAYMAGEAQDTQDMVTCGYGG
ncbi:unnamed protein product [Cladocopium goreaui]|uniref:BART domain-containing protein n=1 Tax=Cladocopium goreaui TaxID=2562237 RepID=A0A9P1BSV0_9DINO|nr:unnamed protein product [Cladocopium goreaui]|mmetsp:Transcript_3368/g.7884  ORF Transcript_3368/g.7884 Transcript_3368/m.7884 type:complete len:147 (-) Transcript_3368:32-472(-)